MSSYLITRSKAETSARDETPVLSHSVKLQHSCELKLITVTSGITLLTFSK